MNLQTDALHRAGCDKIFTDAASGSINTRKGLLDAVDFCRSGDALVVWKLDRLGRSLKHLIDTVNYLQEKGVEFVSLQESVDTSTSGLLYCFYPFRYFLLIAARVRSPGARTRDLRWSHRSLR